MNSFARTHQAHPTSRSHTHTTEPSALPHPSGLAAHLRGALLALCTAALACGVGAQSNTQDPAPVVNASKAILVQQNTAQAGGNVNSSETASRTEVQAQPPAPEQPPLEATRPTSDADLWARIRRGYGMSDLQSELVGSQEQWYATRPSYILRMTERSNKYLYHIVEELERRNMPTELALLPFIESAFNPQAVSSAKAAGMWQFMPATGRDYSLKQNIFRDDRRDVLASTRAALDYMQKLYRMFGDWHLALAAYNWGEGSVQRAINKNQKEGLGTSYLDLNMPNETRNYVPKLQAVKNIVSNPQVFNSSLPEIPNHPYFQSIPLARDLDVALAAKLAEIKLEDFKQLNPSANKPVLFASLTKQILLPWDNAGIFERNLSIHNGQTAGWTVWTAPSTMKAADAARRVGMGEGQFREINRIPPRMLIKAGSTLLVPRGASQQKDVSQQVADNGQISLAPEIVLVKQSVKLRKPISVAAMASKYKVSAANLASWNKVSAGGTFKAKQTVVLYLPKKAKAARAGKATRGGKVSASAKTSASTRAVKGGKAAKSTGKTAAKSAGKSAGKAKKRYK